MSNIHPTALVADSAVLDPSVTVGPYTVIGPQVVIGPGCSVGAHCMIEGRTTLGADNHVFQFASLGAAPQDKKYTDEETQLIIGQRNTIREFCTFNRGTVQGQGVTRIGDDNWIMAYAHIAHDCVVGNQVILANNATLAGHVHVGDEATIGGLTGVHQFVKIGAYAMVGFSSRITQDVPPFMMANGNPLALRGLNLEGMRRRGFSATRVTGIKQMHRLLYRQGLTLEAARQAIAELPAKRPQMIADVALMQAFLAASTRGIVR